MPLLDRRKQLVSNLETVNGARADTNYLTTGSYYDILALEPAASPDIEIFEREFARDTLTPTKGLAGQKALGISFGVEMNGFNSTAKPGWSKWLEASGFRYSAIGSVDLTLAGGSTLATISGGPFRHGEIVDIESVGGSGPTNITATVVMDTHDGATHLWLRDLSGTYDPGTSATGTSITGQSSTATLTLDDVTVAADWTEEFEAAAGHAWWPTSEPLRRADVADATAFTGTLGDVLEGAQSKARIQIISAVDTTTDYITFKPIRGGVLTGSEQLNNISTGGGDSGLDMAATTNETYLYGGTISAAVNEDGVLVEALGARSNVTFEFEANRPTKMNFEARGFLNLVADQQLQTGTSIDFTTPPLWSGASTITYASNESATGNTVADEVTPCLVNASINVGNQLADRKCSSASSGLAEVVIGDRQGSGTLNPEATLEADIDWIGKVQSADSVRLRLQVGTALTNKFHIACPGVVFNSVASSDRDGILVRDMGFQLTGGNLYNLVASPALSAFGGDNEIVIVFETAQPTGNNTAGS